MPRGNWVELVVIVLALASGAIGALVKKLREQAEKKRAQDAMARAELERLRTGRNPTTAEPTMAAAAPAQDPELLRRRREHIERLRRASQPGAADTVVINVPGAGPIVIQRQPPPAAQTRPAPQAQRTPAPQRAAKPARAVQSREPKRRPRPEPAQQVAPRPQPLGESTTQRRVSEVEVAEPAPPIRPVPSTPKTREEWRRFIVMQEVLAPPRGLREP